MKTTGTAPHRGPGDVDGIGVEEGPRRLPPTEEVRPGLWTTSVPMPDARLGYTLVYVLETPAGLVLVDAGLHTQEGFEALQRGLAIMGADLEDVRGIVVTHVHPDHYGLAPRIREASGAWVALHPADAALLGDADGSLDGLLDRLHRWLAEAGAPADVVGELRNLSQGMREHMSPGHPDVLIEDGERIDCPGWELTVVHTPGHSPGHVCLVERRTGVVFTGDHVLPDITPNVSAHPDAGPDPLGDFLWSLERLRPHADALALPAHKHRFSGLGTRLQQLRVHHEDRLEDVRRALGAGASTTWEVARTMTWSTPWEELPVMLQRAACGEARAHLLVLASRGRVSVRAGVPTRWKPTG